VSAPTGSDSDPTPDAHRLLAPIDALPRLPPE